MIQQGQVYSFKTELYKGEHDLLNDALYMALYDGNATLTLSTTTAYTTTNEISGTGYVAGGKLLTGVTVNQGAEGYAYVSFTSLSWASATFTCRGAMIYNSTKSNKAIALLDFGSDKTVTARTFTVTMPVNTSTTALIRME